MSRVKVEQSGAFAGAAVALDAGGAPTEIIRVDVSQAGSVNFLVSVADADLTGLTLKQTAALDGTETTVYTDTDFATASEKVPAIMGSSVHTTVAGNSFQFAARPMGARDFVLYASGAGATVTVVGKYGA